MARVRFLSSGNTLLLQQMGANSAGRGIAPPSVENQPQGMKPAWCPLGHVTAAHTGSLGSHSTGPP